MLNLKQKVVNTFIAVTMTCALLPSMASAAKVTKTIVDVQDYVSGGAYQDVLNGRYALQHTAKAGGVGGKAPEDTYVELKWNKIETADKVRFSLFDGNGIKLGQQSATTPTLWSMDIYTNPSDGYEAINIQTNGSVNMAEKIVPSMLKPDEWNNIALVYHPAADGEAHLGSADLYINGKYISSQDLSKWATPTYGTEYRFAVNFGKDKTENTDVIYMDNVKLVELDEFTNPVITSSELNISGQTISDYGKTTVSEAKAKLTVSSGAAIEIVNANGEAAQDSDIVTAGMKAVATVNIDGVGAYSAEYIFTAPYKLLATMTDDSSAITDLYGAKVAAEKNGLGGKANNDTYLKFTAERNETRFAVKDADGNQIAGNVGDIVLYGFDIYATEGVDYVRFVTTGGSARSYELPAADLNINQWNKVLLVLYNHDPGRDVDGWGSDLYVNGVLKKTGYNIGSTGAAAGPLRLLVQTKNGANDVYYLDNINVAVMDEFCRPEFTSDSYVVRRLAGRDGRIDGYANKTVAEIKNSAQFTNSITSIEGVYNSDGTPASDSDTVVSDMYLVANVDYTDALAYGFFAGNYTYKYIFTIPGSNLGTWSCKVDGVDLVDNKYTSAGKLTAEIPVYNYTDQKFNAIAILAEFDSSNDVFTNVATKEISFGKGYNGENRITLEYDITDTNKTYELYVWDSFDNIRPLTSAHVLSAGAAD